MAEYTSFRTRVWWGALLAASLVVGQHTEGVCNITSLSWSFNSLGQNPCLVAAYLSNPCSTNGDFDVPNIGPGLHYTPPDIPSLCTCSTVVYSLLSACSACQEGDIGVWTEYSENCTKASPDAEYSFAIPADTAVPAWAYQHIVGSNRFNLSIAQSVGDSPENKTVPTSTTTSSPSATHPATSPSTESPSPAPGVPSPAAGSSPGKKSNNTAIIAGSVAGGVVGVAIIGALLAYCVISRNRKNRSETAPSVAYWSNYDRPVSHYTATTSPDPTKNFETPTATPQPAYGYTQSYHASQPQLSPQQQQQPMPGINTGYNTRPYNPDDPSTFPTTPHMGTGMGTDRIPV